MRYSQPKVEASDPGALGTEDRCPRLNNPTRKAEFFLLQQFVLFFTDGVIPILTWEGKPLSCVHHSNVNFIQRPPSTLTNTPEIMLCQIFGHPMIQPYYTES